MAEEDVQPLHTRVVELEAELATLRRRHEELATLADRVVVVLRTAHADPRSRHL